MAIRPTGDGGNLNVLFTTMLPRTVARTVKIPRRTLATFSSTQTHQPFEVFDRKLKCLQKDSAAVRNDGENSRVVDYLRDEVANRMIERLLVC